MMHAVFEGNPYKFWIHSGGGKMHVFDDELGYELFMKANPDLLSISSPNDVEFAESWARLIYDYVSCGGGVVLHTFTDEYDECERDIFLECLSVKRGCKFDVDVIPGHDGRWASMMLTIDYITHADDKWRLNPVQLMRLLNDVYDIVPFEWWQCDSETGWKSVNTGELVELEDILDGCVIERFAA